jgi:hypothetical protein
MAMANETATERGSSFQAERTDDDIVLRFPSMGRVLRAFLPDEAVKHMYAEREGGPRAPRRTEIRIE